jgi:hypothetical protein
MPLNPAPSNKEIEPAFTRESTIWGELVAEDSSLLLQDLRVAATAPSPNSTPLFAQILHDQELVLAGESPFHKHLVGLYDFLRIRLHTRKRSC